MNYLLLQLKIFHGSAVIYIFFYLRACNEVIVKLVIFIPQCVVLNRERPWEKQQNNKISETSGFQMGTTVKEGDTTENNESCTKLNI